MAKESTSSSPNASAATEAQTAPPGRRWFSISAAHTVALALVDQAAVSGTRFAATIFVGRWAGKEALGDYYLAFSMVMLALCVHEALVALPYNVFVQRWSADSARSGRYTYATLLLTVYSGLILTGFFAIAAAAIWLVGHPVGFGPVAAAATAAVPMLFLVEFARRHALAHFAPWRAVRIDWACAAIQVGGLFLLARVGLLTPVNAYLVFAAGYAVVAVAWWSAGGTRREQPASLIATTIRHWRFGRWVFATQLMQTLRGAAAPWIAALLLSKAEAGQLAAFLTIVLLANPFLLSINNILSPSLTRTLRHEGPVRMRSALIAGTAWLALSMTVLGTLLAVFSPPILALLFGREYVDRTHVVPVLALAMVIEAAGMPSINGLWALRKGRANFLANSAGAAVTIAGCSLLTFYDGLFGAACGLVLGRCVSTLWQMAACLQAIDRAAEMPQSSAAMDASLRGRQGRRPTGAAAPDPKPAPVGR